MLRTDGSSNPWFTGTGSTFLRQFLPQIPLYSDRFLLTLIALLISLFPVVNILIIV
jgi:hypothetical protein